MDLQVFFSQETPPLPREGLPYWIFWLLLCIILLLVAFIFLRDKDLRQRLSSFLSGAKRKFKKLRLQAKLKKENQKKIAVLRELGKKAWSEDIPAERGGKISAELKTLDEKKNFYQAEWREIFSEMEEVNKKYQVIKESLQSQIKIEEVGKKSYEEKLIEIREKQGLEKNQEEEKKKIEEYQERIKKLKEEEKARHREHKKETKDWQKKKQHVEEKIRQIEKLTEPLFECLGRVIDEQRIDHKEFAAFYSQIDRANKNIQDLIRQLEETEFRR